MEREILEEEIKAESLQGIFSVFFPLYSKNDLCVFFLNAINKKGDTVSIIHYVPISVLSFLFPSFCYGQHFPFHIEFR